LQIIGKSHFQDLHRTKTNKLWETYIQKSGITTITRLMLQLVYHLDLLENICLDSVA